eukprot:tig00021222_g19372.t1
MTLTGDFKTLNGTYDVSVHLIQGSRKEACSAFAASSTVVSCTLPRIVAGLYSVSLNVLPLGLSRSSATFTYNLHISSVSPTSGSFLGRNFITFAGSGFPTGSQLSEVTLQGPSANVSCAVVSAARKALVCTPTAASADPVAGITHSVIATSVLFGDVQLQVPMRDVATGTLLSYSFDPARTPSITSVRPTIGAASMAVTIEGTGFDLSSKQPRVAMGGVECTVDATAFNSTHIECLAGAGRPGSFNLSVVFPDVGAASGDLAYTFAAHVTSMSSKKTLFTGGTHLRLGLVGTVNPSAQQARVTLKKNSTLLDCLVLNISVGELWCDMQSVPESALGTYVLSSIGGADVVCLDTIAPLCGIDVTDGSTIVSVEPTSGTEGSSLAIKGTLPDLTGVDAAEPYIVTVGPAGCIVTDVQRSDAPDNDTIFCTLGKGLAGTFPLVVYVAGRGNVPNPATTFIYQHAVTATGIEKSDGSLSTSSSINGGAMLRLDGSGFGSDARNVSLEERCD